MSGKAVTPQSGHARALVGGTVVAETDKWEFVEGNVYFPPESVKKEFLTATALSTYCPWKGDASYYTIDVNGTTVENGAWYYAKPFEKALPIKDFVAFYKSKVDVVVD